MFQLVGSTFMSGGSTNMIPANAAMPPAVLRTIAPRPSAEEADDGQVERSADDRARDVWVAERERRCAAATRIAWR